MNSRVNSIFISIIFMCVSAQNTVLKVFEMERNMFYRHKHAKMYRIGAILKAFAFAEVPFILVTSAAFTVIFYFFLGYVVDDLISSALVGILIALPPFIIAYSFAKKADKFFLYYLFVTLALASFTLFGQMLIALFRDTMTAMGFGALFIGVTALFSGIFIRSGNIPDFWLFL
jgi:ABC-type multidrug transport system permease subunit